MVNPADFELVEEIHASRGGNPFNPDGSRTYSRIWRVLLTVNPNNRFKSAIEICNAPGIPPPYSIFFNPETGEADFNAFSIRYVPEKEHGQSDEWRTWLVRVEYSTQITEGGLPLLVGFGDEGGFQNQPWLERPVVRWDKDTIHRAYGADLDGKPFVNSAGQPFHPAPTFEVGRAVLVLTRNEEFVSRSAISGFAYATNSAAFLMAPIDTVRCDPIIAEQQFRGATPYWRVTYRLVFNGPKNPGNNALVDLESWQPNFLDAGTMRKQTTLGIPFGGQPIPIYSPTGPVTTPQLLDGAGQPLDVSGGPGTYTPVFLPFRIYPRKLFGPILDNTIGVIP